MLPHLWHRPVLLRLGIVLVTTIAVTVFAYLLGPPLPYRVGQIYPFDLRVRVDFEVVNQVELVNQKEIERLETNGPRPGAPKTQNRRARRTSRRSSSATPRACCCWSAANRSPPNAR